MRTFKKGLKRPLAKNGDVKVVGNQCKKCACIFKLGTTIIQEEYVYRKKSWNPSTKNNNIEN